MYRYFIIIFAIICNNIHIAIPIIGIPVLFAFEKWIFSYWRRRGLHQFDGTLFWGSIKSFNKSTNDVVQMYKEAVDKKWRHCGFYFYTKPIYMPVHPFYVENVLEKNFDHFSDRNNYICAKDILSVNLFGMKGEDWKRMRRKLCPAFAPEETDKMFSIFTFSAELLQKRIEEKLILKEVIDLKDLASRYATDTIAKAVFGIDCNSLTKPDSEFRQFGNAIFDRELRRWFYNLFPTIANRLGIRQFPKKMSDFFTQIVKEQIKLHEEARRKKEKEQVKVEGTNEGEAENKEDKEEENILKFLLQQKDVEDPITDEDIIAQAFSFFLSGFEKTSNLICCSLLEIGQRIDIQEKLKAEICEVLQDHPECKAKVMCYDCFQRLDYMNMVIYETLRKYPPVPIIRRQCTKTYKFPDSNLLIEKGTSVNISVIGIHYNDEFYPEPNKFDPMRFTEENKAKRPSCTYLQVGAGDRNCLGRNFGWHQVKWALCHLLRFYNFEVNDNTKLPLKFRGTGSLRQIQGDLLLNASRAAVPVPTTGPTAASVYKKC